MVALVGQKVFNSLHPVTMKATFTILAPLIATLAHLVGAGPVEKRVVCPLYLPAVSDDPFEVSYMSGTTLRGAADFGDWLLGNCPHWLLPGFGRLACQFFEYYVSFSLVIRQSCCIGEGRPPHSVHVQLKWTIGSVGSSPDQRYVPRVFLSQREYKDECLCIFVSISAQN